MDITEWDDPERIDDLEGGQRRVLSSTDDLVLVHYALEEGAEGEPHAHEEATQATFVIEGRLELRGEYSGIVEAGDSYAVPPGTIHGVRALEPCRVIDAFTPPLEAYTE
ncbi:cupin domain-containing protein [Natrinema sp. H-ect1]|uniref:cupin domain-containing protein n=1 Tax=Natrinema sp. H-ect1 TaxID=3242700 RepID=UPI00359D30B1